MRSRAARTAVVLVGVGLCLMLVGVATAQSADPFQLADDQPEPDNTVTRITLAEDGNAVWTIRFRTQLPRDDDVAEYERFQAAFRNNTSRYLDPFEARMTGVVDSANDQHSRPMRAVDFDARTNIQEVPRRWGVVTFEFRWEGFAEAEADQLVVGDVFVGGFFIGDGDVLEIAAPSGYGITAAEPMPAETTETVVQWNGREDFADGRPRVVATPGATGETGAGGGPSDGADSLVSPVLLGVIVVAVGLTAGFVAFRRQWWPVSDHADVGDGESRENRPSARESIPATHGREDSPDAVRSYTVANDGPQGEAADTPLVGDAGEPDAVGGESTDENVIDDDPADGDATEGPSSYEIVTNEEQVIDLLEQYDGQLKQADIVESLGWSKSKTSRILSEMADDGAVEKLRLGRENVIRLSSSE